MTTNVKSLFNSFIDVIRERIDILISLTRNTRFLLVRISKMCISLMIIIMATAPIVAPAYVLSYLINSLIIYGVCWCFGFAFTWKLSFGIWLILSVIKSTFSNCHK